MNKSRDISYCGKKVYAGIDVHRREYSVSCVCDNELVKKCRMAAKPEGLLTFLLTHFKGAKIFTAYEAGFSGFILHRYLSSYGINSIVVNASSIEIASRDRVKTDKRDSLKIAVQLSVGRLTGILIPSEEQELRRLITRSREQLIKEKTRIRNQIRFKLHQFGLIPIEERNRLSILFVKGIISKGVANDLELVLNLFLSLWESIQEQIDSLEKELKKQAKENELEKIFRSVPGVALITARTLANELGDMSQFKNAKCLYSYAGLTPCENSSGETRKLGHISRQGNPRIRRVLTECAWVAINQDPSLARDFKNIASRAGKKKAIVAIARKLLGKIRAVIRDNQMYKINYSAA